MIVVKHWESTLYRPTRSRIGSIESALGHGNRRVGDLSVMERLMHKRYGAIEAGVLVMVSPYESSRSIDASAGFVGQRDIRTTSPFVELAGNVGC